MTLNCQRADYLHDENGFSRSGSRPWIPSQ